MLGIEWKVTTGDIVSTVSIVSTLLMAWWQLRKSNKQNRAEFVVELMSEHVNDRKTLDMLYKLEYGKFVFNEIEFPQSDDEKNLDKILYTFDQIALLHDLGVITRQDLSLIEYDFLRVYTDDEVQRYFSYLDKTPHGLPTNRADFRAYRKLAKKLTNEFKPNQTYSGK